MAKVQEKIIIDGVDKLVTGRKTKEECQHIKNAETLEFQEKIQMKPIEVKGSMESLFGKLMEVQEMGKVLQLSVVFYILSKGHAMTDYPSLSGLLHFVKICYYPRSHWSVNNRWECESCLSEVEKKNIKEKFKESNFIALSLDEVTTIDNTSWVCMLETIVYRDN